MSTTLFVKHQIGDYSKWKNVYDGLAPVRQKMGVIGASVYRDANDKNTLIVTHQFNDMQAATAFTNSEDFKDSHGEKWGNRPTSVLVRRKYRNNCTLMNPET